MHQSTQSGQKRIDPFKQLLKRHLADPTPTTPPSIRKGMLIYYYYNRSSCCYKNASCLLTQRAEELRQELQEIASDHRYSGIKRIPSGQTFRLLQSFCSLIVDVHSNTFNPGGAEAVIELLSNPIYKLSHFLHPEHREQVLRFVRCCLQSDDLQTLLVRPYTPLPEMRELIAQTLIIPLEEVNRNPAYLSHALLMPPLFHLMQDTLGNCYAISALNFELRVAPARIISELITLLQEGHIALRDAQKNIAKVPILPLVENRFNDEQPLEKRRRSDRVGHNSAIEHATGVLAMDIDEVTPQKRRPVSQSLQRIAHRSGGGENYPKLVRHLASFDNNPLQEVLLLNRELPDINQQEQRSAFITHINSLCTYIFNDVVGEPDLDRNKAFAKALEKALWFDDIPITTIKRDGFGPTFDRRSFAQDLGTHQHLRRLIQNGRFLFTLINGNYSRIDTIEQFQHYLCERCAQVFPQEIQEMIASHLTSTEMHDVIAKYLEGAAAEYGYEIPFDTLKAAGLIIFPQTGGYAESPLNNGTTFELSPATARECLENLWRVFSEIPQNWIEQQLPLLANSASHSFLLIPHNFSHLINSTTTEMVIDQEVEERFEALLDQPVLEAAQMYLTDKIPELTITHEEAPNLTHRTLLDKLRAIDPTTVTTFYEKIIHAFSLIQCDPVLISRLLSSHSLDVEETSTIYESLKAHLPLTTQQLAEHLSRQLQEKGMKILHPVELERTICVLTGRPATFVLGSLNWAAKGPESNSVYLELAYEPVTQQFVYLTREEGEPKRLLDAQEFTDFSIHLPNPNLIESLKY